MIKQILIVDDHHLVRNGLRLMLENQTSFEVNILEASNGIEALDLLQKNDFDLTILDISMPIMDGMETLKKIKKYYKKLPVLMLTMHNEEKVIKQLVKLGANGYLLKNSGIDELIEAILNISNDANFFSVEIQNIINKDKLSNQKTTARKKKIDEVLSEREIEILRLIIKEMTNKQIADHLSLSYRTIEGHRTNIMEKLNIKSTIGLVKYAIKSKII